MESDGFSGADIDAFVNEAVYIARRAQIGFIDDDSLQEAFGIIMQGKIEVNF